MDLSRLRPTLFARPNGIMIVDVLIVMLIALTVVISSMVLQQPPSSPSPRPPASAPNGP